MARAKEWMRRSEHRKRERIIKHHEGRHGGEVHDSGHWIAGAIKHPGALHRELGVPQGKKIPAKKLAKAEHSSNPKLRKRARLAETLKHLYHGR